MTERKRKRIQSRCDHEWEYGQWGPDFARRAMCYGFKKCPKCGLTVYIKTRSQYNREAVPIEEAREKLFNETVMI